MPNQYETIEQAERRDARYAAMDAPRSLETEHKVETVFTAALRAFDADFPGARRPTAEKFARERFVKACAGKVDDPRFDAEAPGFARLVLCQEHAQFNEYAR